MNTSQDIRCQETAVHENELEKVRSRLPPPAPYVQEI